MSDDVADSRRVSRESTRTEPLGYIPALDGLRGYSMIVVMFYHARFAIFPGGFLAVSIFFTLSGFLITSLLLREWASDRAIDMRAFWSRRFRRLLPAAWLTLALVAVAGALGAWDGDQLISLHGDVPFSLLQVVNWHFILENRTYGGSFTAPTPVEHYWSLSVEEQFYLFIPLLVLAVLRFSRSRAFTHRVRRVAGVLAALIIVSAVLNGVLARTSIDRVYFGTDTRMAEMLAGGLLACATVWRLRYPEGLTKRLLRLVGLLGLVAIVVLWRFGSLRVQWMYPWGLLATAAATCAVIIGSLQGGVSARVLAFRPIAQLGRMSYGTYLVHWPIFLILTPARTGLPAAPLFAVRFIVSVALATLIFYYVEEPIRRRRVLGGMAFVRMGAIALPILLIGSLLVTSGAEPTTVIQRDPTGTASDGALTRRSERILMVGDQTVATIARGLADGSDTTATFIAAPVDDCGLVIGGWILRDDGTAEQDVNRCHDAIPQWTAAIERERPDLVVVVPSARDAAIRWISDETGWIAPDSTSSDGFHAGEFGSTLDTLTASAEAVHSPVLVASAPATRADPLSPAPARPTVADPQREAMQLANEERIRASAPDPESYPGARERLDAVNVMVESMAGERNIGFVDLAGGIKAVDGDGFVLDTRADAESLDDKTASAIRDLLVKASEDAVGSGSVPVAAPAPANLKNIEIPPAPDSTPRRKVGPGENASILVVGDSISYALGYGLVDWAQNEPDEVGVAAWFGCPIARGGRFRVYRDTNVFADSCEWATEYPRFIAEAKPDVVLLSSSVWQVVDRQLPGDSTYRHMGDDLLDRYVLSEFLSAVDVLAAGGATVAILTGPYIESGREKGFTGLPESDHARMDRFNEILAEVHRLRPDVTELIDLQAYLDAEDDGGLSPSSRPDGIHFSDAMSRRIGDWLGPQLDSLARGNEPTN